ncbi:flagellar basal body-associated FliL family protein [Hydrogenophaga sp.]|uniref:flagellar basal body-associated FliL family protein n=1 Tax=Hydrogenophaga sp. TaxID=1904254 RepID=UPI00272FD7F1|nr:flagellar basal body-associated FliL family protein [Hydrogenophaga sp.]MDP2016425.1 flagellar basal body-associated FliL family protein [Hydrogenophaga sp.]MDP3166182.1 flagellar basal body-associated FliL family protein [Hydrogenophaga sp.]MDP3812319.1 flagellar basal body-associated FliL family protein [Hydrogenophaga sp.]
MSAAAATATAVPAEAPKKKSKKLLFIIVGVVLLALIGAGAALFIMKKNAAADDESADGEPEVTHQAKDPKLAPTFLPLENMVVNLADPGGARFIQLGLTLQLQDAKTEADVKTYMPSIRSDILLLISQRTADEMLQVQGKAKLANDIIAAISKEMGYVVAGREAGEVDGAAKTKKKSPAPPNPVQAVLFSSLIVQ